MRFARPLLVKARAQGLLLTGGAAAIAVAVGCGFGGEQIGVPGLLDPIPAVRIFPAVVGAIGALTLLEPWRDFELTGVRSTYWHRTTRFWLAFAQVFVAGAALSANAGSRTIGVLAVLVFAVLAALLGLVGPFWWTAVAAALYGQFFLQEFEEFRPGPWWALVAVLAAWPLYLSRGESLLRFEVDGWRRKVAGWNSAKITL